MRDKLVATMQRLKLSQKALIKLTGGKISRRTLYNVIYSDKPVLESTAKIILSAIRKRSPNNDDNEPLDYSDLDLTDTRSSYAEKDVLIRVLNICINCGYSFKASIDFNRHRVTTTNNKRCLTLVEMIELDWKIIYQSVPVIVDGKRRIVSISILSRK